MNNLLICCCRVSLGISCPYGERCTQAHSERELEEWKEYFKQWKARLQSEASKQEDCQFAEQLMEKWMNAEHPETVVSYCIFVVTCVLAAMFLFHWVKYPMVTWLKFWSFIYLDISC